jgi:repressor LexA
VAKRAGVDPATLSLQLSGQSNASEKMVEKLWRAMGLPEADLYAGLVAARIVPPMKTGQALLIKEESVEYIPNEAAEIVEGYGRWSEAGQRMVQSAAQYARENERERLRVPLIGRVAAGTQILAEENIEGYIGIPRRWMPRDQEARCFALVAEDDFLIEACIRSGDIVAARTASAGQDGQIVVALTGEEAAVKRLRLKNGQAYLLGEGQNSEPPIRLSDSQVIGIPIGVLHPL